MKKYVLLSLAFLTVLAVSCLYSYTSGFENGYSNRIKGYKYAAEWGCYQGAQEACAFLEDEQDEKECTDDALKKCPEFAKAFETFMSQPLNKK